MSLSIVKHSHTHSSGSEMTNDAMVTRITESNQSSRHHIINKVNGNNQFVSRKHTISLHSNGISLMDFKQVTERRIRHRIGRPNALRPT